MSNRHVDEMVSSLRDKYATETLGMSMGEWICANTTVKRRPFSFAQYQFQKAIADDLHPDMDVMKISQVGLTEVQIRKACALCIRNPGMVGIFSLPDEKMYKRVSQGRITPLLTSDKIFAKGENDVRSMDTLQFGQSFLYVVNAVESAATSTSADFLFNDEVDISNQAALALFASRLQNSNHKIKQRFSTPTWAGYGIHGTYSVSDQREYLSRCSACNHWQLPLFDSRFVRIPDLSRDRVLTELDDGTIANLDLRHTQIVCEKCDAPLDLDDPKREWVATYPTRTARRGYRVRPFSTSRLPVEYILNQLIDYRKRDYARGWWNTVLGEPYMDSKSRISEEDIRAVMDGEAVPQVTQGSPVYVGIDMGQVCHIVVGNDRGPFWFRTVKVNNLGDAIREIQARYTIVSGASDRHPYTPTSEEVRDITQGLILPVEYRGEADLKLVEDEFETVTHAQVNRTRLLDSVAKAIRTRAIRMAGYGTQQGVVIEHLRDNVREEHPEKPAKWIKLTGNDHYLHALAFFECAKQLVGARNQRSDERRMSVMLAGISLNMGGNLVGSGRSQAMGSQLIGG